MINNLYSYLKTNKPENLIVITTKVAGGWDDVQFDATAAGYTVTRFIDQKLVASHKFSECYKFTRR